MALSVDDLNAAIGESSSKGSTSHLGLPNEEEGLGELETSSSSPASAALMRRRASSSQHHQLQQALQQADARRRYSGANNESPNLRKVELEAEYIINKQLGTGRFGYVKLAEHKASGQKIALKFFPRPQIKHMEFMREYNFSRFLSPHPNILDTFEGVYQSDDESAFFFVQEFCPHASLREAVEKSNGGQ